MEAHEPLSLSSWDVGRAVEASTAAMLGERRRRNSRSGDDAREQFAVLVWLQEGAQDTYARLQRVSRKEAAATVMPL